MVGSTFNIQNFIPDKSQKTKVESETNRVKEFQRGTAGVPESAKEGARGLAEGSDIGLGSRDRAFESPYSDHMNGVRFSNIFIEKRTSHFLEVLQQQGFFYLRSFNALMKKRKMQKDYFFAGSEFEHCFFEKYSSSNACGVLYLSVRFGLVSL